MTINDVDNTLIKMIEEVETMKDIVKELRKQVTVTQCHGEWLINSNSYSPYCSKCGEEPTASIMTKYCDHCGSVMDGKTNKIDERNF